MVDLVQKKVGKLIGLKKSEFNNLIRSKEIFIAKPRLIPTYKMGDEMALTSVLLSSFRLIKEFRQRVLSEAKIQKGGKLYAYTEITFKDFPESRIDGLILVIKAGTIRDAVIIEVKNGKNTLERDQLERYQQIAKQYSIPKFITISNQFVTDSTQCPISVKNVRNVDMYHFSWTYLLTIAHILLFNNDTNIEDEDQVEIMKEVVKYFEHEKSGIVGHNQMNSGWADVMSRINSGEKLKVTDDNVRAAALSWQQEERDMALILSRELGVLVNCGEAKYKGKLTDRIKADAKKLTSDKQLSSTLRVKGAASDIKIYAMLEKRTVEMTISLKPPGDKTYKGQLGWIKRQFDNCSKKEGSLFDALSKELYLEVLIKNSSLTDRFSIFDFEPAYERLKGKEIREFKVIYLKDLGRQFSSSRKFVETMEGMLTDYYTVVIQHLNKWEPSAPKLESKKLGAITEEDVE